MNITENVRNTTLVAHAENNSEWQSQSMQSGQPVYFTYKDRVFRLLFKDRGRLLELYNALNNTAYTQESDLIVNTLENAIFMKMRNDVSFLIHCDMCLYEHQSTYCPNMPLRGLLYLVDLYKKHIKNVDLSVNRQIKIPTPHIVVFYNGTERDEEEFIQRLSDAFEDSKEGCIEVTVRVLNINYGHNKELMDKCRTLSEYAYFVAEIRRNLKTMSRQAAVETAIDTCIEKDVLRDFLTEQKAEVIAMSIYEYNEEYVKKTTFEDGYDAGQTEKLIEYVNALINNLGFDLQKACESLGITVEDYQNAKEKRENSYY